MQHKRNSQQKASYSKTFLYRMHLATTLLDKAFDNVLRMHAQITLSQFTLLLAIEELQPTGQRAVVGYLKYTPGAVSRGIKAATMKGWLEIKDNPKDKREQIILLTAAGSTQIECGLRVLESHGFTVFKNSHHSLDLFGHLDDVIARSKEVIRAQKTIK